jgi:hypothetical protein
MWPTPTHKNPDEIWPTQTNLTSISSQGKNLTQPIDAT